MPNKSKKNKKYIYIMSAAAILAAAAMAVMLFTQHKGDGKTVEDEGTSVSAAAPESNAKLTGFVKSTGQGNYPLLSAGIDGFFYEANPGGVFTFYKYADGSFAKYDDVETAPVSVECSAQEIPATIYYIKVGDEISGCGLFTTAIRTESVEIYNYAFFRLVTMPEDYGNGDSMLLVDFDKVDFAKEEKTYSEIYSYDTGSGKSAKLTGDNGRLVDEIGRERTDWAVMTDNLLDSCGGKKLYLSGRNYNLNTLNDTADVLLINDTAKKPTVEAQGILGAYLKVTDDGLVYMRASSGGFDCIRNGVDGTETKIASLAGDYKSYLRCGDYLLSKDTLVLTNIVSGESKTLSTAITAPTAFSINDSKLVLFKNGSDTQQLSFIDLASGTEKLMEDASLFAPEIERAAWLPDGSFMLNTSSSSPFTYSICAF